MATGKKGSMTCTYIVGRYRPAGNMGGEYKKNVPKGKFTQDVCKKTEQMAKDIDESVGKEGAKDEPADGAKAASDDAGSKLGDSESEKPNDDASGGGGAGGGADGNSFQQGGLKAHNKFRDIHGTSAMKLNKEMNDMAEAYAKKLAQQGSLQHASASERKNDGENLAYSCSSKPGASYTGAGATRNWYVYVIMFLADSTECLKMYVISTKKRL